MARRVAVGEPCVVQTADLVGEVRKMGDIGAAGYYFDPGAWVQDEM